MMANQVKNSKKQTISIIVQPIAGYVNAVSCLAYNLCQSSKVNCIFYGLEHHREIIEKTGSEFRLYSHPMLAGMKPEKTMREESNNYYEFLKYSLDYSNVLLPGLLSDVEKDTPDLIIYDQTNLLVKLLLEILEARHLKEPSKWQACPRHIIFDTTFAISNNVLEEMPTAFTKIDFWTYIVVFFKQIMLNWRFGISVYNTMSFLQQSKAELSIFSVYPNIQPNLESFDEKRYKFVGSCISEVVRSASLDSKLQNVLDSIERDKELKLVYVSLGTFFYINSFIFEAIIEAIERFDQVNINGNIKKQNLRVVMSVGTKEILEKLNEMNNRLMLTSNIFFFTDVPQIEVLKKSSLYFTHCGMNSTCEALKYGVPMICIPIDFDQPMIATTLCEKLKVGVRLDPLTMRSDEVARVMCEVLTDRTYANRSAEMAKSLSEYNGGEEASRLILEYMDNAEKKTK